MRRAADHLLASVHELVEQARQLFYALSLLGEACPRCGGGLRMLEEGRCTCLRCHRPADPTLLLQRCPRCEGRLNIVVRRYRCSACGEAVDSRFRFDSRPFDAEYFRRKMAESRSREREHRTRRREQYLARRSQAIAMEPASLTSATGLFDVLNALVGCDDPAQRTRLRAEVEQVFDLLRYEQHILSRVREAGRAMPFDAIPHFQQVREDGRLERVRLFIAALFLAHRQQIRLRQSGETLLLAPPRNSPKKTSDSSPRSASSSTTATSGSSSVSTAPATSCSAATTAR